MIQFYIKFNVIFWIVSNLACYISINCQVVTWNRALDTLYILEINFFIIITFIMLLLYFCRIKKSIILIEMSVIFFFLFGVVLFCLSCSNFQRNLFFLFVMLKKEIKSCFTNHPTEYVSMSLTILPRKEILHHSPETHSISKGLITLHNRQYQGRLYWEPTSLLIIWIVRSARRSTAVSDLIHGCWNCCKIMLLWFCS